MVIRRLPDGLTAVHRLKSNALDGLSLGVETNFSWASFSGKATYQRPDGENEGNHTFIAYVEDRGQTGDRFWLQVKDKNGNLIAALSLAEAATANAVTIVDGNGNIVAPGSPGVQASADAPSTTEVSEADSQVDETLTPDAPPADGPEDSGQVNDGTNEDSTPQTEHKILLPFISR